jgi:hypothetical protein
MALKRKKGKTSTKLWFQQKKSMRKATCKYNASQNQKFSKSNSTIVFISHSTGARLAKEMA